MQAVWLQSKGDGGYAIRIKKAPYECMRLLIEIKLIRQLKLVLQVSVHFEQRFIVNA